MVTAGTVYNVLHLVQLYSPVPWYTVIAGTVQYQSSSTKLYLQLSLTAHLRVLSESDLAISFPMNQLPPIISSFSFTP